MNAIEYQNIVHKAVHSALTNRPDRRHDGLLWVSDLGRNPYIAIRRVLTGELDPFDYPTLLKMDGGNALEAATLKQVAENIERTVHTQFPLFNATWSGYADLVIGHGTDDVVIYDHKGSAGKWWDYKASLPRTSDCCQVWMYGHLYQEMFGITPRLGLYYRGWGSWAEFEITQDSESGFIQARGIVTNEKGDEEYRTERVREANPQWLREEIEHLYFVRDNLTLADIERMIPDQMDWHYAEDATSAWHKRAMEIDRND